MEILHITCQLLIGLGIFNVWFLRFRKSSSYRGGSAANMKEEFAAYGLPEWSVWAVGALKVGAALMLLVGIAIPALITPAATIIAMLMAGAVVMHFKIGDPATKSLPAALMLLLALLLIVT